VIGDIIEALHPRRMMAAVPRKRNSGSECRKVCPGHSCSGGGFSTRRIVTCGGHGVVRLSERVVGGSVPGVGTVGCWCGGWTGFVAWVVWCGTLGVGGVEC
jgi:hypothetical protein